MSRDEDIDSSERLLRAIRARDLRWSSQRDEVVVRRDAFKRRKHCAEEGLSVCLSSVVSPQECMERAGENAWAVASLSTGVLRAMGLEVKATGRAGHATIYGTPDPREGVEQDDEANWWARRLLSVAEFVEWRAGKGPDDLRRWQERRR